jgi:hypothetical protein
MTDRSRRPPHARRPAALVLWLVSVAMASGTVPMPTHAAVLVGDDRASAVRPRPDPITRPTPDPPSRPRPFAMNLFDPGDFVAQRRSDWCVPASILTMMNMIDGDAGGARPTQARLDRMARRLSTWRLRGAGSEPEGWARTLDRLGLGPYRVRAERTQTGALETAARAIRSTRRPVGLLVWRGAHAWVVSGFRATADPAVTDDFTVTHLFVHDPLYPNGSSIWGRSSRPNTRLRARDVASEYLAWRRPHMRYPAKDGRFVLVVPVAPAPTV